MSHRSKVTVIFLLAVAIYSAYFHRTPPHQRAWDFSGHVEHIEAVRRNPAQLAPADACWQCYHPPLYYLSAAAWATAAEKTGASPEGQNRSLQIHSLVYFLGFLLLGLRLIRRNFPDLDSRLIAGALLIFWPSGLIHSVRIGNDVGFYFFHTVAICLIAPRLLDPNPKWFRWAAAASVAALLTKATGFVTIGIVGAAWLWRWRVLRGAADQRREALYPLAIVLGGIAVFLLMMWSKGKLTNASALTADLVVRNGISNFLGFDASQYFQPFSTTRTDETGRQFAWIFMMKSSLFGEFVSLRKSALIAARESNLFLLGILAIAALGWMKTWRRPDRIVLAIQAVFLAFALVAYRAALPFACSGDFRYIYPLILSVSVFFSDGHEEISRRWPKARAAGPLLLFAFLVLSDYVVLVLDAGAQLGFKS